MPLVRLSNEAYFIPGTQHGVLRATYHESKEDMYITNWALFFNKKQFLCFMYNKTRPWFYESGGKKTSFKWDRDEGKNVLYLHKLAIAIKKRDRDGDIPLPQM